MRLPKSWLLKIWQFLVELDEAIANSAVASAIFGTLFCAFLEWLKNHL